MRRLAKGLMPLLLTIGAMVWTQQAAWAQARILEYAETNKGVGIPSATIQQYLRDMDRDDLSTLRMIEGGKFNVNIRRIRDAETALVHPNTVDLWVVIEGSGTLTTGGSLVNRQIENGRTYPLKVGDVVFIPAGTPHGVSGVNGNITWLNIRWDTDWPTDAATGAGNYQTARSAVGGGRGMRPQWYAGGAAIYMPKENIDAFIDQTMADSPGGTVRLVEGGHFNVNIRTLVDAPEGMAHPITVDTWVVLRGGGQVCTSFEQTQTQRQVPATGDCWDADVGSVIFAPADTMHGWRSIDPNAIWLNVRWDTNYASE